MSKTIYLAIYYESQGSSPPEIMLDGAATFTTRSAAERYVEDLPNFIVEEIELFLEADEVL